MNWERHSTAVALIIASETMAGLTLMLADAQNWKGAGFILAAAPVAVGLTCYVIHLRRR